MRNKIFYLQLFYVFFFSFSGFGQLQNGTTAPNFTLTDIEGNQHELYQYLDQGKTVYLDFFACHCPFCWSYHNTNALQDLYTEHGPNSSTDDIFVIAIDLDANNGLNEFYGISGNTQGNWVEGTDFPQTNPEGMDLVNIREAYQAFSYPLIYAICPDRTVTNIGKKTKEELYAHVSTCEPLGLQETLGNTKESFGFTGSKLVVINGDANVQYEIRITDIFGRIIETKSVSTNDLSYPITQLSFGVYFAILEKEGIPILVQKFEK